MSKHGRGPNADDPRRLAIACGIALLCLLTAIAIGYLWFVKDMFSGFNPG